MLDGVVPTYVAIQADQQVKDDVPNAVDAPANGECPMGQVNGQGSVNDRPEEKTRRL